MTDDIELQERDAFVIYHPTKGFVKNKNSDFSLDFLEARIFQMHKDAADSIKKKQLSGAVIIPVHMELDPRKIFTAVLAGA